MKNVRNAILMATVGVLIATPMVAQQNSQVNNLLMRFKNWRYGMVSVYKVTEGEPVTDLNILLGPPEPASTPEADSCRKKFDVETYVETGGEGLDEREIQIMLRSPGCKAYERYFTQKLAWQQAQFKKAFIVTTRRTVDEPFEVIGLLVQKNTESYYSLKDDLDPPSDIFLADLLQRKDLDETKLVDGVVKKMRDVLGGTAASNLLQYLENQVIQGNFENVTPEAQGIGEPGIEFVKKKHGVTTAIPEDNAQMYMRISDGAPQDYANHNEVIVSFADGISYRRYERDTVSLGYGQYDVDTTTATNRYLPKYGVELKYGLDEINYPSLWSERVALNALWGSSSLGIILPTNGWSDISTTFGNTRTMTHGGLGVNGAFDFPIKVISSSGLFHLSASYVFDDASQSDHMIFNPDNAGGQYEDYMVRFHASFQYSFAVAIDKSFLFRLRLGGTVYNMETWTFQGMNPDSLEYRKFEEQTLGGISGRVDFMTVSWSTPAGFSLSYFDETMLALAWLQIPIINQFNLRLDAKVFAPVFRDPRPWEQSAVVIPTARFIINF
jgi:hypothetical protein